MSIYEDIAIERHKQVQAYGDQADMPFGTGLPGDAEKCAAAQVECDYAHSQGTLTWRKVLREEYREVLAETDRDYLREELVQLAAVCVAMIEKIDREATQ